MLNEQSTYISRDNLRQVTLVKDFDYDEYRLEFYKRDHQELVWEWQREASYYTDDKEDALGTAEAFCLGTKY